MVFSVKSPKTFVTVVVLSKAQYATLCPDNGKLHDAPSPLATYAPDEFHFHKTNGVLPPPPGRDGLAAMHRRHNDRNISFFMEIEQRLGVAC